MTPIRTGAGIVAADGPMGDGTIDNWVVSSDVHVVWGVVVVAVLAATLLWTGRLALGGRDVDRPAVWLTAGSTVVLVVQALLGIKLLDQGSGFGQLFIHYLGGLLPVGLLLVATWMGWHRAGRSARPLFAVVAVGTASAAMAFAIGQAYVDSL